MWNTEWMQLKQKKKTQAALTKPNTRIVLEVWIYIWKGRKSIFSRPKTVQLDCLKGKIWPSYICPNKKQINDSIITINFVAENLYATFKSMELNVWCVCELWNTRNLLKLNAQCDNFSHSSLTLLWKIANYYMCDVCVGLCTCIKPTLTMHYIYMNPYTFMQSICKQKSKLYTQ